MYIKGGFTCSLPPEGVLLASVDILRCETPSRDEEKMNLARGDCHTLIPIEVGTEVVWWNGYGSAISSDAAVDGHWT